MTAAALGVEEIATFRDQVRSGPSRSLTIWSPIWTNECQGAAFHDAKQTLNLTIGRVFGVDLVRAVQARLQEAAGRTEPVG